MFIGVDSTVHSPPPPPLDRVNDDDPPTVKYNADPINSESFKYKSSITEKISNANRENGARNKKYKDYEKS